MKRVYLRFAILLLMLVLILPNIGSSDETVRLRDASTRRLSKTLIGHTSSVNSVYFSPDGKTLASREFGRNCSTMGCHYGETLENAHRAYEFCQ